MRICKESDSFSKVNRIGIFAYSIIVAFVVAMFFAPTKKSDAGTATVDTGTYSASIANSGAAAINIAPTDSQAIYSETDVITYTNTCPHGFSVTLSSTSENTGLIRASDDSYVNTIPTISTNGSLTDNTWGFSTNNGTTYNAIPPLSNPVAILETTSATTNATNLNVVYGVKIDNTIPSGGYTNDVVYTLSVSSQCLTYNVSWDFDGGTAADGVVYPSALGFGQTIDLTPLVPTKDGNVFAGWSNGTTTFGPESEDTDVNPEGLSSIALTAQWNSVEPMQDFDPSTLSMGQSKEVVDIRDNKTYTIKKLNDGKVWMTENLGIVGEEIDSSNSDLKSGETFTIPESDMAIFGSSTSGNGSIGNEVPAAYYDSEKGGFYNWHTATAGTVDSDLIYGEAKSSICPKGWRLPTGGEYGEYQNLYNTYNSYELMTNDDGPRLVAGGYIAGTRMVDNISFYATSTATGRYMPSGYFWNVASMRVSNDNNPSVAWANISRDSFLGSSVRCVVREPENDIPVSGTMQNFNSLSLSIGQSTRLTDTRDGNVYKVKKLADGKVWMSQDLRLGGTSAITLTTADSDVASSFVLPASSNGAFNLVMGRTASVYVDNIHGTGYYNWYTATGGEGGWVGSGATADLVPQSEVSHSICPKGWRLPVTMSNSESDMLKTYYSSVAEAILDAEFSWSGYANKSTWPPIAIGQFGYYWALGAYTAKTTSVYYLAINTTTAINTTYTIPKDNGIAIRCIAR